MTAAFLLVFGFFPLANLIPGGMQVPWYRGVALDFLNAGVIVAGLGLVGAILFRQAPVWRDGRLERLRDSFTSHERAWTLVIGAIAFLVYAVTARQVLSGKPLLIDEIIQVFQARILSSGHFWTPAADHPEFFSSLHLVEQAGRVYGQFPIGGPAMLALGSLLRVEWLVDPAFGAGSVVVFGVLVRRVEPRPLVALGALVLFALAPFAVFMSGSHMNHVTALFWILVALNGLARATGAGSRRRDYLVCGLGFGLAATIRPLDAAAFAVPAAVWLLLLAYRVRRFGPLFVSGLGVLLPLLVLGWANRATTGSPFQFGYTVLWGAGHGLGFHAPPWGEPHTPLRGIELINTYFLRFQTYLFEFGIPSLLPATIALGLTRKLSGFDRYLIIASGLLVGLYFAYWHDGFYLGPRFMYPLLPLLALWSARLIPAVRSRSTGAPFRFAVFAGIVAIGIGVVAGIPNRVSQYRAGMLSLRWDADRAAERAGVRNALVLVRESWGAELVARLWSREVGRPQADAFYRTIDPCRLDSALTRLERDQVHGPGAVQLLAPLQADSGRLIPALQLTGDPSLRLMLGAHYSDYCVGKLKANQSGFTLYSPLLLARGDNVYARDLGARDSLLLQSYPDRPVYLLKPVAGSVGAAPVFHRLSRDSVLQAWRSGS